MVYIDIRRQNTQTHKIKINVPVKSHHYGHVSLAEYKAAYLFILAVGFQAAPHNAAILSAAAVKMSGLSGPLCVASLSS